MARFNFKKRFKSFGGRAKRYNKSFARRSRRSGGSGFRRGWTPPILNRIPVVKSLFRFNPRILGLSFWFIVTIGTVLFFVVPNFRAFIQGIINKFKK